ncbi:MAG TPA: hypothetical protein VHN99_10005 [Deinococcales bacterium]|nr:hypothetical protein [Deinococcales bacterium]
MPLTVTPGNKKFVSTKVPAPGEARNAEDIATAVQDLADGLGNADARLNALEQDGAVQTNDLHDLAVTEAKLDNLSVSAAKLQDGAANDDKIGQRTIAATVAGIAPTGKLGTLLNWLAGVIQALSGETDWRTLPSVSLKAAVGRLGAVEAKNATFYVSATIPSGTTVAAGATVYFLRTKVTIPAGKKLYLSSVRAGLALSGIMPSLVVSGFANTVTTNFNCPVGEGDWSTFSNAGLLADNSANGAAVTADVTCWTSQSSSGGFTAASGSTISLGMYVQ